ncbi:MAG TPA: response regulator transcription factor [Stellaceae bacterium]|nr:response regulator transcription factor [Stellaceae bacterium]
MPRRETSKAFHTVSALSEDAGTARLTELSFPDIRSPRPHQKLPILMAFIDSKPLTRQSISEMLTMAFPDNVTIAAASCEELIETQYTACGYPHLVIVIVYIRNARVTDRWIQDELQLVRLRLPDAWVVMLSDRDDADEVAQALGCGVRGYIPTSIDCEVAFAALNLISAGGTFVPAHVLRSKAAAQPDNVSEDGRSNLSGLLDLTHRELAVLQLLREGKSNKLIAALLKMQESTVKVHVRNILKKLRVSNRTQAAAAANRLLGPQMPPALSLPRPASGKALSDSKMGRVEAVRGRQDDGVFRGGVGEAEADLQVDKDAAAEYR